MSYILINFQQLFTALKRALVCWCEITHLPTKHHPVTV